MPQQVEDIETIKKKVINLWLVMHARHRLGERSLENDELESLINNLLQLKEQLPNLNDRNFRKIVYLYENLKKDKVKDIKKCYFDLFKALTLFVSKLETYVQKERIKHWGVFLFSKIFPNTFNYLKEYMAVRQLEYYSKEIPDVKVLIFSSSQIRFLNNIEEQEKMGYLPTYFANGRIEIDLSIFYPANLPKDIAEVNKILKLIDSRPTYQSWLIHEYQHFLQDKKTFKIYNPFTWFSSPLKDSLPREIGIRVLHDLEKEFPELRKRKEVFISHILERNDKWLKSLGRKSFRNGIEDVHPYEFRPIEIEARLTQLIFMLTKGYDIQHAVNILGTFFNLNRANEELAVLLETKKELEELIVKESSQLNVAELKKRIERLDELISIHKQITFDMTYLTQEAERVASEIIRKRQETEIK